MAAKSDMQKCMQRHKDTQMKKSYDFEHHHLPCPQIYLQSAQFSEQHAHWLHSLQCEYTVNSVISLHQVTACTLVTLLTMWIHSKLCDKLTLSYSMHTQHDHLLCHKQHVHTAWSPVVSQTACTHSMITCCVTNSMYTQHDHLLCHKQHVHTAWSPVHTAQSPVVSQTACTHSVITCTDRLVGQVVKASASRAEDPGFESHLCQDFFGVESYQWLKNWHSSDYPARRLAL